MLLVMALISEVPLACKWPVQAQPELVAKNLVFWKLTKENNGVFFIKNQPELCFLLFISCVLH